MPLDRLEYEDLEAVKMGGAELIKKSLANGEGFFFEIM